MSSVHSLRRSRCFGEAVRKPCNQRRCRTPAPDTPAAATACSPNLAEKPTTAATSSAKAMTTMAASATVSPRMARAGHHTRLSTGGTIATSASDFKNVICEIVP